MATGEERGIKQDEVRGYAEALANLRAAAYGEAIIAENFLDADLETASERFWNSEEWRDTVRALQPRPGTWVLDYGAGRCLASLAFARLGCHVVALDINPSSVVGLGVLSRHNIFRNYPIYGVVGDAEHSMFPPGKFDIVYCREALHHAFDLETLARSLVQTLKPGGQFYAYGEHRHPWWSSDEAFRKRHPAVQYGANEHSYTQSTYRKAMLRAGLRQVRIVPVLSPLFAEGPAPVYHRAMLALRRLPVAGQRLYRLYVRVQMYRSVGSQNTILGRK